MSERERATGECDCGNIIYGPGVRCEVCSKLICDFTERPGCKYPHGCLCRDGEPLKGA